jgi:hypothetical protein
MHVELSLKNLPVYALIGKELQMKSMQREVRGRSWYVYFEKCTHTHTHAHVPRLTKDKTMVLKATWFTENNRHPICKALTVCLFHVE